MSDFGAIPEKLKERDQWLMWDAANDSPRRPHWRGNFYGISWSNPDDWHSFEEAIEAAEERESWGIGYVFAAENPHFDGGKYGFLDLDNCLREARTEKPKEWVPQLDEFLGGYIEYSGGKHGLHIPFEGELPSWWSNDTDDEHEGPEAHTNKFCAFTADTIGSCDPDGGVVCDDISPFLLAAYEKWNGNYPELPNIDGESRDSGSEEWDGDEWLEEEDIEDALEHLNPDMQMEEWWNIGRAVQDYDDGAAGKRLYTEWSKGGQKWDEQAPDLIDWLWSQSDPGTKTGLGTLLHHAKNEGWDMPSPSGPTTDGTEVVEIDGDDGERELPTPEYLSVHDGGYGYWKENEDESNEWVGFSNFQLETQSFATDPDDPDKKQIELTVHPAKGEAYDVTIPPTVFNEKREFKSNVVTGLTTTFSGKESVLNQLKTFVGTQDAPLRTGTYQMGRFGGEWVTPEGVLTAGGWSDNPDHIHVSRDVGAERKWDLVPEDGDEFDSDEVAEILELLPETRDVERFIPAIGWFWSTPFKPLIQEWTGQFNLLGVLGETGAGKSATLSVLWELFGMGGDPMTADDTKYVLLTTLASTNSIPMWFDEYKPSDMSDWAVDTFWNEIRKTTRGGVSARGRPDGSTEEYHLSAPAVVSGEERVHGSAEERRGIYTTFKKSPTDPESESAQAFAELMGGSAKTDGGRAYYDGHDLSQHALAYYQWALSLDDDEVREQWRESARHVSELLAEHDIDGMEDLVEQGLQTIKFGATLYRAFTDAMGGDADALPNGKVDDAIIYTATNAIGGANRKSHLDVLFEVAARAARHDYLEEDTHYKFVREGEADEEFRLNLTAGFDKIVQYGRDHDVAEDLLNSKDDYRERIGDALDADDGYIAKRSIPTSPIGRAVGIYVRQATESIDGFDKSMFGGGDEDESAIEERIESAQTAVSPTAVADLSPGYQTLTVECVTQTNDTPDVFAEMGTLRDATGTVDYVVWDRAEPVDLEEGETYRIRGAQGGTDPDDAPQVELDGRTAEIETIDTGVGYLALADSGNNERLGTATDGGEYEQAKPRMKELLKEHGPCSEAEWKAKAHQAGISDEAVDGAFESLKGQGEVYRPPNGEWEVAE